MEYIIQSVKCMVYGTGAVKKATKKWLGTCMWRNKKYARFPKQRRKKTKLGQDG